VAKVGKGLWFLLLLIFFFFFLVFFCILFFVFRTYNRIINWALVLTKLRPKILMIFFLPKFVFWALLYWGPRQGLNSLGLELALLIW
jgi:hypothetical protein